MRGKGDDAALIEVRPDSLQAVEKVRLSMQESDSGADTDDR
jgi:hypothetical protein